MEGVVQQTLHTLPNLHGIRAPWPRNFEIVAILRLNPLPARGIADRQSKEILDHP